MLRDQITQEQNKGFDAFMSMQSTKMILSMLPPSEHIEAAFRVAFEHGFSFGIATALTTMITRSIEDDKDRR